MYHAPCRRELGDPEGFERRGAAHATVLVQGRASSGTNLMVSGEGDARVIRGVESRDLNRRVRAKYVVEEAQDALERAWGTLDDVTLEIAPRRWRSWTGTLLHEAAAAELGSIAYEDAWRPN